MIASIGMGLPLSVGNAGASVAQSMRAGQEMRGSSGGGSASGDGEGIASSMRGDPQFNGSVGK